MKSSISHPPQACLRRHSIAHSDQYQYALVLQQTYSSKYQTNRKFLAQTDRNVGLDTDVPFSPGQKQLVSFVTRFSYIYRQTYSMPGLDEMGARHISAKYGLRCCREYYKHAYAERILLSVSCQIFVYLT